MCFHAGQTAGQSGLVLHSLSSQPNTEHATVDYRGTTCCSPTVRNSAHRAEMTSLCTPICARTLACHSLSLDGPRCPSVCSVFPALCTLVHPCVHRIFAEQMQVDSAIPAFIFQGQCRGRIWLALPLAEHVSLYGRLIPGRLRGFGLPISCAPGS